MKTFVARQRESKCPQRPRHFLGCSDQCSNCCIGLGTCDLINFGSVCLLNFIGGLGDSTEMIRGREMAARY